jgi:hypothetical protein
MDTPDAINKRDEVKKPAPFIYINGYAGVGKLSIAKYLLPLLPQPARLLDNHLLIDPVAALLDRSSTEYQPLRKSLRQNILSMISSSEELRNTTIVFTDQQSSSALGSSVAREYETAAQQRNCLFLSVRIECGEGEHLRRALSESRKKGTTTKLTDERIIKLMRNEEDVFKFGCENEITMDVTDLLPGEAAKYISDFVGNMVSKSMAVGI